MRQAQTYTSTVPLAAFKTGDFSALLPRTVIKDPTTGTPLPGNLVPASTIDSTSAGLVASTRRRICPARSTTTSTTRCRPPASTRAMSAWIIAPAIRSFSAVTVTRIPKPLPRLSARARGGRRSFPARRHHRAGRTGRDQLRSHLRSHHVLRRPRRLLPHVRRHRRSGQPEHDFGRAVGIPNANAGEPAD